MKRYILSKWIAKTDSNYTLSTDTCFRPKDTHRLKVEGWKNIFHANSNQKRVGWLYKYQTKWTSSQKLLPETGHYIKKGAIDQEDITIITVYAPNIRVSKYMRQTFT